MSDEPKARRPFAMIRLPDGEADRKATALAMDLELKGPWDIDLVAIAAHLGAFARFRKLEREVGRSLRAGTVARIAIDPSRGAGFEWRSVLGHELGHVVCDGAHDDFARCLAEKPTTATRHVEVRATDFGSVITMPTYMFAPMWGGFSSRGLDAVRTISRVFKVPVAAAALRALLFERGACAAAFSADGHLRWWARANELFDARIYWGRRIHEETLTGSLHRDARKRETKPRPVPSKLWGATPDDGELVEEAVRVEGGVLTWLSMPERGEAPSQHEVSRAPKAEAPA